ncbi:nascent polypeptide-associated complex subunit beta [Gaeumannomyces tritici R3-111a-1]|uniref:Nascent polypeptide-associated complex subunit beta n=1 Tax=Gaeumannomyces tritici (strain R3-111a-1) TaxID=644352 RepID=J3PDE7_GAET3|nr:nascent polypeptide-associated complex subunit beta [Gaeumannomyces tritici R3-111a-1]EJT70492.1 nascent polypeptide-associated complex subunit beta [Gaeumannomyces tritici R3-111a-1]
MQYSGDSGFQCPPTADSSAHHWGLTQTSSHKPTICQFTNPERRQAAHHHISFFCNFHQSTRCRLPPYLNHGRCSGASQEAGCYRTYCGKGTPRRKVKRAPARSGGDDKKLQQTLKKLNVQPIQAIEEVNMFKSDGNVIHFAAPKVHAAVPANTFAIYGNGEDKELTELVPGILNQLGPDSLASLRKLAESYQNMQKTEGDKDADDDDIPELVAGENFEDKVE